MNIVVLGGTGYIGSHVALELARLGHQVTVVARLPERGSTSAARAAELRAAGVVIAHADLGRPGELVAALDPTPIEVIVHGVCSFLEPAEVESLTLRAMTEMLALARRCPRLVQAIDLSNNLVLDPERPDDLPDEEYPCRPLTAHGQHKLKAEQLLQQSGLPWVVLRLPQVYGGVGSSFEWVMLDPIRRGAFPVPGDGRNRVSLVHVDDAVQAVRLVIARGVRDRVYHIASGERDLTLGAVFDEVARGFGVPRPRRLPRAVALVGLGAAEWWARVRGRAPTLVADMVRALASNRTLAIERARRELGFEPIHPDTLTGIRSSYSDVFSGQVEIFAPAGRLAAAQEQTMDTPPTTPAEFWQRWSPWRYGELGQGTFADVMRVLRLHDRFAEFAIRQLPPVSPVEVLDLGCGAVQLAGPLLRALGSRDLELRCYVGVDFADPKWMPARVATELARTGLQERSTYLQHDLGQGLPPALPTVLDGASSLLITSCWGITYLPPEPLAALLRECCALAAQRPGGAVLCVNMMPPDRNTSKILTRRFLGEVVPRHLWSALRQLDADPLRHITLALRALPRMRQFGTEIQTFARLMPVAEFLEVVRSVGLEPTATDPTALWGATQSFAIHLPGSTPPEAAS